MTTDALASHASQLRGSHPMGGLEIDPHASQLRGSHPLGGLEIVETRLRGSRLKAALKLTRHNFAAHASPLGGLEVVFTRRRGSRHSGLDAHT